MPTPTVRRYAITWLARQAPRVKVRTLESYRAVLARYVLPGLRADADQPLDTLRRAPIQRFAAAMLWAGYAPTTVHHALGVLRALLTAACVDDELGTHNAAAHPARLVRGPPGPRLLRVLARAATQALLAAAWGRSPRLAPLFVVMVRTGLRLGEALALRWESVDLGARRLVVRETIDWRHRRGSPKGGRLRTVPLSRDAVAALTTLVLEPHGPLGVVFHGPSGRPWSRVHVWRTLARCCAAAGLPRVSAHDLRRSCLTQLAAAGVHPLALRDLAGHHSVTVTEGYIVMATAPPTLTDCLDVATPDTTLPDHAD